MNTTYTENAAAAEEADTTNYQEILEELMEGRTLRQFADQAGMFSHTLWGHMKSGERPINRAAKNRLLEMVGLPALPQLPIEAAAEVDANARIYRTGTAPFYHMIVSDVPIETVNPVTSPCNLVTRRSGLKSVEKYRRIADMPMKTLAYCIRERRDYV